MNIRIISKAIAGGLTGAASALTAAAMDNTISTAEWFTVVGALLAGFALVYASPSNQTA